MPLPVVRGRRIRRWWRLALLTLILLLAPLTVPLLADEAPGLGVAAGVERQEEAAQCLGIGNNWTACDNAFASDDAYAYANVSVSEGIIAYRSNTGTCGGTPLNCAKTRTWDGTTWGSEVELSAAGSDVQGTRVVWDPKSDSTEHWIVAYEGDGTLDVYHCSAPGSCSLNLTDAGDLWAAAPGDHSKPYDIAYEATSRDLLLVYEVDVADPTRDLGYRTFSRSTLTWSAEQYLDHASVVSSNPEIAWVEFAMSVDAGTNNVGLLFFDTTDDDALLATWDGTGWRTGAHQTACSTTVTRTDSMGGTIAAEGRSGEYLALCGNGGNSAAYKTWTEASGWSAATIFDPNPVPANDLRWLSSHPRPGSDEIMVLYSDDLSHILASRWSGSALGTWTTLATDSQAGRQQPMGFAWNPDQSTTADGLVVYDINTDGSAAYRTWDNTLAAWTAQSTFSAPGTHRWVEVVGNPSNETLKAKVFLHDDGALDILGYNWTGSGAPTGQFIISPDTTTRNFEMWESAWGPAIPGKNDTVWKNFGLNLNAADTVNTVEIGVEWFRDNVGPILNVNVSWDGGTTWGTAQAATNKSADDDTVEWLDFTAATAWDTSRLGDMHFRVRVGTNASGARLDYVTVRVNYNAAPRVSDFRLEDGAGMSRAGARLNVGTEYRFLFTVIDEDGWSDIGTDGSLSLRLWYDGNVTPELTYGAQTNGTNYRIELGYVDTLDSGNASLDEWSVREGRASYAASASSATAILNGSLVVGFAFNLSLTLGYPVQESSDPTDMSPGAYNDPDSWNAKVVATDAVAVVTHRTAATGEHMEFGVFFPVPVFSPVLHLDPSGAERGDVVLAILYFNNTGTGRALRAWANWSLGGHYELVDILPAQTYSASSEGFDIRFNDLVPGSHSLLARLRVIRGLEDGLAMEVRVAWSATDGRGNALPGATLSGVISLYAPSVTLALRSSETRVQVGADFSLDATVLNVGQAAGEGWLNLTLPPGVVYVSSDGPLEVTATPGLVSWRIVSLAPDSRVQIAIRLKAEQGPSLESFVLSVDFTDGKGSPPLTVFSNQVFVRLLGTGSVPLPLWLFLLPLFVPAAVLGLYLNRRLRHPELRIEEVFVIHRKGILVAHQSRTLTPDRDRDILAAMFKAVQAFVQDAFSADAEGKMRGLRFENFNILIEQGTDHYLAVVYQGQESRLLERRVAELSRTIEAEFGSLLASWAGDMNEIRGIRRLLPVIWGESAAFGVGGGPEPVARATRAMPSGPPKGVYESLPGRLLVSFRRARRLFQSTSFLLRDLIEARRRVLIRIRYMARLTIGKLLDLVRGDTRGRRFTPLS